MAHERRAAEPGLLVLGVDDGDVASVVRRDHCPESERQDVQAHTNEGAQRRHPPARLDVWETGGCAGQTLRASAQRC